MSFKLALFKAVIKCKSSLEQTHSSLQGPIDICELQIQPCNSSSIPLHAIELADLAALVVLGTLALIQRLGEIRTCNTVVELVDGKVPHGGDLGNQLVVF